MMEIELEPRVKPLGYKVKGMSRESPSQKAAHVLETDLRTHWSTGTNTKEWILLELDFTNGYYHLWKAGDFLPEFWQEPCLLSHLRIYNKSVLEWEIAVGLRYKPETFVKVRPRCEAPRRDMIYPMNYAPCRYVRISCLRGNPIAIFFIQLIGISVTGLEPEFQPIVNHLMPSIIANKQETDDMHLRLLQDITNRLLVFIPQLEAELTSFSEDGDQKLRFFAMLVGPLYPILHIVNERERAKSLGHTSEFEVPKNNQLSSSLTVSSNFEPRRSRSASPFISSTYSAMVFRPDVVFMLLRKAYKESDLATVCRLASRILHKLVELVPVQDASTPANELASILDETPKSELSSPVSVVDYSSLFGDEFRTSEDHWDLSILNVLDMGAVEEGILHVLYACASQPLLCHKLAESSSDLWSALPLIQALLPALRPAGSSHGDHVDDNFSQWKQPFVQQALSQIVATSCSGLYRPLLHSCAGYLSSFSPSHAKSACVLIDLCSGVLAPWMAQVIAKVDLTVELLEDLLGTIQNARHSLSRARAALKYIVLALSGHMDDVLWKYKEVKHKVLFLVEMLEPFLDPAIHALKSTIAFGDVSFTFSEKQEHTCVIALNIIRTAVQKPAVLPSLESEWRRGSVAPSVLLSILEPQMQLPPDIDLCKSPDVKNLENKHEEVDRKADVDTGGKMDIPEDVSLLFAPSELRAILLTNVSVSPTELVYESNHGAADSELKDVIGKKFPCLSQNGLVLDTGLSAEYLSLQADYFQLMNYRDCELRASEFRRLALDLHSQDEIAVERHDAAIDALLLAAECYVNPFFTLSFGSSPKLMSPTNCTQTKGAKVYEISDLRFASKKTSCDLETVSFLEKKRDKIVLQLLLEAAELNQKYQRRLSDGDHVPSYHEGTDEQILSLSPVGVQSADAVTLVRQNQALLCTFLIQRLKNTQHSVREILMHCLVFLLHSATQLYCYPEDVLDIILGSAEYLTGMLTSCYDQLKEGNLQLNQEKVHGLQRRWILLKRLVIASSGGEGSEFSFNVKNGFRCGNLIPSSAWMQKISTFSCSSSPLVRFLGWMAVSRNAKQYIKERLFLASDLSQLTYLLSIFADELVLMDNVVKQRHEDGKTEYSGPKQNSPGHQVFQHVDQQYGDQSFHIIYPHLSKFFPNLKEQFESFGENILEAVGLQLRSLSYSAVPDILCWFSDLCSWPFFQDNQFNYPNKFDHWKGHVAKNAKAVILYILEAIVIEHMEAMVPEIPRVVQVLVTLCRASYCDVSFVDSVMQLLRPIISYSLCKASDDEKELADDDSCLNFEALCFEELFANIRQKSENQDAFKPSDYNRSLTIFTLASLFADLSFQRRREILQSLILWADFTAFEPTTAFHDYLCAFQMVLDSCKNLLIQTLRVFGALPLHSSNSSDSSSESFDENGLVINSSFLNGLHNNSYPCQISEKAESIATKQRDYSLPAEEIEEFSKNLEDLLAKLNPTIERCWNLHHLLAKKLTVTSAQCFSYLRCLCSVVPQVQNVEENVSDNSVQIKPVDQFLFHWRMGLEGLSELIIKLQENNCWEVASLMLDCLLGVPGCCRLHNIVDATCCAIKGCSSNAPKISWRLQSDKWLSMLLPTDIQGLHESDGPVADLFVTLLVHPEPEQRFIALQHLGRLVGQDINGQLVLQSSMICDKLLSPDLVDSVPEQSLSLLVSSTWDRVVLLASSDTFLPLRTRSMALLIGYIPHAARHHLRSFFTALDNVLPGLGKVPYPTCEGPLLRLSLALIAVACLYSPAEDISLIPQDVWRNIEKIGSSKNEGKFGDLEKNACKVLCGLRTEGDESKKVLKEVLSSTPSKQVDPDFGSTRESILQVLANLTSVQSYFEFFSQKIDQEAMELEEAEIELDVLEKEYAVQESLKDSEEEKELRIVAASAKDDNRLQQIKDRINTLDKSKLQEEIVARRQKKLLMRRARQKYLDEAALREEELLQELDREKTAEAEKEIERQRLLELERTKTRELRHNLDMEKERQTQRELQRELEQAESGLRSSRREFSSSTHSRPRDRYREKENGRSSNEGSARTTSGSLQPDISTTNLSMAIPNVLSGSRSFSGQPPIILQSRDRLDDCGSSYEENFDGSRDSGDTGSVGDPELVSAFDGQSSGYGSGQRHGSRGSKSRQVTERREREGRREGKWERKH